MTIISLIEQEWSILGDPGAVSWIGRKGGKYLKTFVPPFLPTDCPWVSKDGSGEKFSITFAPSLSL